MSGGWAGETSTRPSGFVLGDGRVAFVKTRGQTVPGEYAAEAAGLAWLSEPGLLRTPAVLEVQEEYLALEWIEPGRLTPEGAEELGRALAGTHRAGAATFGAPPGTPVETGFGSLRLGNEPAADWAEFYGEQRLRPLGRQGTRAGLPVVPGGRSGGAPLRPARASWRAHPSRRLACMETSGRATSWPTIRAGPG